MLKYSKDMLAGFLFIAFEGLMLSQIGRIIEGYSRDYPFIVLICCFICTVGMMVQSALNRTQDCVKAEKTPARGSGMNIVIFIALVIAYIAALILIGYVVPTALFLTAALYFLGARSIPLLILLPAISTGVLYFLFTMLFSLLLPRGLMPF